jgi:hypothetical protein
MRMDMIERWLHEEVAAAYDELEAYPETVIPASEVFAAIHARNLKRIGITSHTNAESTPQSWVE